MSGSKKTKPKASLSPQTKRASTVTTKTTQAEIAAKPDWQFWLSLPSVQLWQAAYLTLGIDPDTDNYRDIRHYGTSDERVEKRLRVLEAHFGAANSSQPLLRVAALGSSIRWIMPKQLWSLVQNQTKEPEQIDATASVSNGARARGIGGHSAAKDRNPEKDSRESASPITTHRVPKAKRTNILAAVIQLAKDRALKATDWQSVWASLVDLAEAKERPAPLLGFSDDEGVKYQDFSDVKFLSKKSFQQRWNRANPAR